jgi:hypothetical protein
MFLHLLIIPQKLSDKPPSSQKRPTQGQSSISVVDLRIKLELSSKIDINQ